MNRKRNNTLQAYWLKKEKAYLRYLDTQSGDSVIVFIHGLGCSSMADYTDAILDKRFNNIRCILVDLLGFGLSDKPQGFGYSLYDHAASIAELLDVLQIKKATVFGHSLGGTIAIALTQIREDLVDHLIVSEPNLDPGIGTGSKAIASQSEQFFVEKGYWAYLKLIQMGVKKNPSNAIYYGTFRASDPVALHRSSIHLVYGTKPPQREILRSLKIPCSYIVSEENINDEPVAELKKLGFRVFVVPNSGHALMHDNPEGFKEKLLGAFACKNGNRISEK